MYIKPFAALRPAPALAAQVASVPYDVLDTAEARKLAAGNPNSFLRVSRPEIDLPDSIDIHDPSVYQQGARALQELQTRGVLLTEERECLYLYRQKMGAHTQVGVVACCHIDDYANNVIRKHEKTRRDKEDDRTQHCQVLNANTGPVFLTYRDSPVLDSLVAPQMQMEPLYDFTAVDGVQHTVWRIEGDTSAWIDGFQAIELAYVADGHHRAAAAFRTGHERRAANPAHNGSEEYNWFLAVLFPASQLQILPYNRCVADLNGLSDSEFLARVRAIFTVTELTPEQAAHHPAQARQAHMYLAGTWYRLSWPAFDADPVSLLDVSVLQERLLTPLLGVTDPRVDNRILFVGGIRGLEELKRLVDNHIAAVAFAMHPVTVDQMMDIADADQIMAPKSTWFEPKLRSGLLVHSLMPELNR